MKYNTWELQGSERSLIKERCTHFNLYYNSTKKMLAIFNALPVNLKKYRLEMLCILTNVARAIKMNASYLELSRDYKVFKGNAQMLSYRKMIQLQDLLERLNYIDIYIGGVTQWDTMTTSNSFILVNSSLTELFSSSNIDEILQTKEFILKESVVIRNRKTKEVMNTKGVDGVSDIRDKVNNFNAVLTNFVFSIDGNVLATPQYMRSFSDGLGMGGRYYEKGSKIQNQSQSERKKLMINDETVVELDYKSLHASLLYETEWQEDKDYINNWITDYWEGKYDPYGVPMPFLEIDQGKIDFIKENYNPNYNPVRNISKYALMVSLNADSYISAQKAVIQEYKDEYNKIKKGKFDLANAKYYGIEYTKVFPGSKVMNSVANYNTPIKKYLFSDAGIKLQNTDSNIMSKIIDRIISEDHNACIPEHDAVIVKVGLKEKVKKYMKEAYKEIMLTDKFCYVEEK